MMLLPGKCQCRAKVDAAALCDDILPLSIVDFPAPPADLQTLQSGGVLADVVSKNGKSRIIITKGRSVFVVCSAAHTVLAGDVLLQFGSGGKRSVEEAAKARDAGLFSVLLTLPRSSTGACMHSCLGFLAIHVCLVAGKDNAEPGFCKLCVSVIQPICGLLAHGG